MIEPLSVSLTRLYDIEMSDVMCIFVLLQSDSDMEESDEEKEEEQEAPPPPGPAPPTEGAPMLPPLPPQPGEAIIKTDYNPKSKIPTATYFLFLA